MKKLYLILAIASLSAFLFSSCGNDKQATTPAEPEPEPTLTYVRFYITGDQAEYMNVQYLGKINGGEDFVALEGVTEVPYCKDFDEDAQLAAEVAELSSQLVILQAPVTLKKGKHQFKMVFSRNSVEFAQDKLDLFVGIKTVQDSIAGATVLNAAYGGVETKNIPDFIDQFLNSTGHVLTITRN